MRRPDRHILRRLGAALACVAALGLGPASAQDSEGEVALTTSSLRLALMQLATSVDASVSALIEDGPEAALYLQSGEATLAQLAEAAEARDMGDALTRTETGLHLARPLVVLPGARLRIAEGDHLTLGRDTGAFILALGSVSVDGATLQAAGRPYDGIPGFRPFLAGVGQRSLSVTDSTVVGLGYGGSLFTGGVFVGAEGLLGSGTANALTGNNFVNLRTVTLSRLDGAEVRGNRFEAFRGTTLLLTGGQNATVSDNRFLATRGAHALHVSGLRTAGIDGNAFDTGGGKAIRIDDDSSRVHLRDNTVSGFEGTAVTVAEGAGCLRLDGNTVEDNIGGGIALDRAGTVILDRNLIARNRGAGLAIDGQLPGSTAFVLNNDFDGNRMGIRGTGLATVRLAGNDLSQQMPRLLAGDLDQVTPTYLDAARDSGEADIVVEAISARLPGPLRADAADRAFDDCAQEEAP